MKTILISIVAMLCLIPSCSVANEKVEQEYFLARITFYTDCPIYGKKTASQRIAEEGTTIAASKNIPFGTQYYIPRLKEWIDTDGKFRVDDRGPEVDSRKASRGKLPVIDIYVDSKAKVRQLGSRKSNIFKVFKK